MKKALRNFLIGLGMLGTTASVAYGDIQLFDKIPIPQRKKVVTVVSTPYQEIEQLNTAIDNKMIDLLENLNNQYANCEYNINQAIGRRFNSKEMSTFAIALNDTKEFTARYSLNDSTKTILEKNKTVLDRLFTDKLDSYFNYIEELRRKVDDGLQRGEFILDEIDELSSARNVVILTPLDYKAKIKKIKDIENVLKKVKEEYPFDPKIKKSFFGKEEKLEELITELTPKMAEMDSLIIANSEKGRRILDTELKKYEKNIEEVGNIITPEEKKVIDNIYSNLENYCKVLEKAPNLKILYTQEKEKRIETEISKMLSKVKAEAKELIDKYESAEKRKNEVDDQQKITVEELEKYRVEKKEQEQK